MHNNLHSFLAELWQTYEKKSIQNTGCGVCKSCTCVAPQIQVALSRLRDAKSKGARNLHKNERCQTRRTYLDFQNESRMQESLPKLDKLLSRDLAAGPMSNGLKIGDL